jgi:hypothetical protein
MTFVVCHFLILLITRSSLKAIFFHKHMIASLTKKKAVHYGAAFFIMKGKGIDYIIPPIPPIHAGGPAGVSSLISASTHSVVSSIPAIEAAFSRATRVTLVGSITPAANMFS